MTTNTMKKAAGASTTNGLHTDTNGGNFLTDAPIQQVPDGNAITTQIARLALAGHVVHKGGEGDFIVSKYGLTRYCSNFAELQTFARQLGVK